MCTVNFRLFAHAWDNTRWWRWLCRITNSKLCMTHSVCCCKQRRQNVKHILQQLLERPTGLWKHSRIRAQAQAKFFTPMLHQRESTNSSITARKIVWGGGGEVYLNGAHFNSPPRPKDLLSTNIFLCRKRVVLLAGTTWGQDFTSHLITEVTHLWFLFPPKEITNLGQEWTCDYRSQAR